MHENPHEPKESSGASASWQWQTSRLRFEAAWQESLRSVSSPPNPEDFEGGIDKYELAAFRVELASIAEGFRSLQPGAEAPTIAIRPPGGNTHNAGGDATFGVEQAATRAEPAAPASDFAAAQKQFDSLCGGCHGEGGNGGDRAPALVNNPSLRTRNEAQIRDLIKSGTISFNEEGSPFHWVDLFVGSPTALTSWTSSYSESGVLGDAELGTAEKGRRVYEEAVKQLVRLVTWFKDRPKDRRRDLHRHKPTMPLPWEQGKP